MRRYDGTAASFVLDRPEQVLWAKINYSDIKGNINSSFKTDLDMTLIQIGADLYKNENKGLVAGVYAGYGTADQHTQSTITGSKSSGDVDGYQIGVYGSWKSQQLEGLHIDAWGYYAWFNNELKPASHYSSNIDYDSTSYSLAAEVGYDIKIAQQSNGNTWYIQPNARLGYVSTDADSFYDFNSQTRYDSVKSSGIQARLGARIYNNAAQNNTGWVGTSPYVEINWIHNGVKSESTMNYVDTISDKFGENVGEVKIGVQSRVTDRFSLWGHVGLQRGSDSFKRNEVEVGFSWSF